MASRDEKRGWSQAIAIPGVHPPLIFSVIVAPPVLILWLLRSPDAQSLPSQHLVILGVAGFLGVVAAMTSRCTLTLRRKPSDGPLVAIKVWRILWIPLWRTQRELRSITSATAAQQLDLIGFFFFFLFALFVTWVILIAAAVAVMFFGLWVISGGFRIVLVKIGATGQAISDGALSEPGSFLDSINPGKTCYAIRLIDDGKNSTPLCRRLSAKQVNRVLHVLRNKASLELVRLPPEFA